MKIVRVKTVGDVAGVGEAFSLVPPIVDAVLVSSNIPEDDNTGGIPAFPTLSLWSSGTTYGTITEVRYGTPSLPNINKVFESLQAGNLGHDPTLDDQTAPVWWLLLGKTNKWKMFDQSVDSQSEWADEIAVVIDIVGLIDSVTLLNCSAATARVTMTDDVDGVVYDQTQSFADASGITDWYAWFFEPVTRNPDIFFGDLPLYADAQISVTLDDSGAQVLCGACIFGLSKEVGGTDYGAAVGIQDYSVKTQDDFGNFTILQRAFSRRASFTVRVDASYVDTLFQMLASLRAIPALYIGSDGYTSTIVYGFFKDFSIEIAFPTESICSIEIEGLT